MVTFGPKLQKAVSTFICGSGTGLPSEALDSHLLVCVFLDIIQPLNLKGFRHARSQTEIYLASMNPKHQSHIQLSTPVGDQNQILPSRGSPSTRTWNRSKVSDRTSLGMSRLYQNRSQQLNGSPKHKTTSVLHHLCQTHLFLYFNFKGGVKRKGSHSQE